MKRTKGEHGHMLVDGGTLLKQEEPFVDRMNTSFDQQQAEQQLLRENSLNINTPPVPLVRQLNTQLTHSTPVQNVAHGTPGAKDRQCESRP